MCARERRIHAMKQLFNDNWYFCKFPLDVPLEDIFTAGGWNAVDLPHDWMIYDTANLYEEAVSCYKKTITKEIAGPEAEKIWLLFEGVYMDTNVYLNQKHIFTWKNGYS